MIEGSREVIDLKFGFGDPAFLHHQQDTADKLGESSQGGVGGLGNSSLPLPRCFSVQSHFVLNLTLLFLFC